MQSFSGCASLLKVVGTTDYLMGIGSQEKALYGTIWNRDLGLLARCSETEGQCFV